MSFKKLILATLLATGSLYSQTSVGIDINDEDIELFSELNVNTLTSYSSSTTYLLSANYLHTDNDNLLSVGFSGENSLQGMEGLTLAFGVKIVFADEFMAMPLFAKGKYLLPLIDAIPPTSVIANIAYAPSTLSFRDADNYLEFRVEADMEVISNIHIFAGYRNIDTNYENNDYTFNDSIYAGMKLSF